MDVSNAAPDRAIDEVDLVEEIMTKEFQSLD